MSSNEAKINEYELDVAELKTLLSQASRASIKQVLQSHLDKCQNDLVRLKAEKERLERLASLAASDSSAGIYTKKIDTFGWDQSDKFVKIYITSLNDVDKVKESDVVCKFTDRSVDLTIKNLNKVNYKLAFNNLLHDIVPEASYFKCKSDMIAVFMKKADGAKNWPHVTQVENKTKEKALPKFDDKTDPQEGLMSMMRKMYEEGDDEMKRTIGKAFSESREKGMRGGEGMPTF